MNGYEINPERIRLGGFTTLQGRRLYARPCKRWISIQANVGLTTRSSTPQNAAQTPAGTLSNADSTDGPWINTATAASSGSAGDFSDSGIYRRDWGAWGGWRIKTAASIADVRIKVGFVSGASANSDYGGTLHQAELVYSTPSSFGGWRALTNDNADGTGTSSGDLASIAADTVYEIEVMMRSSYVLFGINGRWVHKAKSTLPGSSTLLFGRCQIISQAAAAKSLKYARSSYLFEV